MVAAAGFATIAGTTTLIAVTDDGKAGAKTASAAADQAKGTTQPAPAKAGTTRGGSAEDAEDGKDADYWAEHAGNPGWKAGDNTEDHSADHDGGDADEDHPGNRPDGDHEGKPGPGAADSGDHDDSSTSQDGFGDQAGKPDPGAADAQKRAGRPSGPTGQNGPEGHSGRDGQGGHHDETGSDSGHREEASRQGESGGRGQDGHRDSHEDADKARSVDCDPNDLISAITQANSDGGGTLALAEKCTYTLTANQDGNGLPEIVQPITIHGNGATIARAANADQFRFFEVGTGGDLKLRHLTLTRGKTAADEDGGAINVVAGGRLDLDHTTLHNNTVDDTDSDDAGAIYNEGITTIRNSTLSGNSGYEGGAIHNEYGKLEVETSKFTNNKAYYGGGAIINYYGTSTVRKSLFSYNYGEDYGGAVYQYYGLTDIEKSAFKYNYSGEYGGAVYHENDALQVRKSTFAYNTGYYGGALYLDGEQAVIEDSKIYGNTSLSDDGGGINNDDTETHIRRTVISGNQAPGDGYAGGGIHIDDNDEVTLTDVKVTDNTSDEPAGGVNNDGGTVTTYGKIKIIDNVPTNCEGSASPVPNCFG
ncbi:right-handed parallel beta-helix repeat-containing protein [Streptomyces sp. NPDC058992]|uniref:right-handed parallel beta-helix repeat-containing protein n=1 Tax=Streptomyces sp. NPDC058992 TaxID=3346688 RepID=UPI0036C4A619